MLKANIQARTPSNEGLWKHCLEFFTHQIELPNPYTGKPTLIPSAKPPTPAEARQLKTIIASAMYYSPEKFPPTTRHELNLEGLLAGDTVAGIVNHEFQLVQRVAAVNYQQEVPVEVLAPEEYEQFLRDIAQTVLKLRGAVQLSLSRT